MMLDFTHLCLLFLIFVCIFFFPRATIEAAGLHEIFVVVVLVPVRFSSAVLTQTGFIGG